MSAPLVLKGVSQTFGARTGWFDRLTGGARPGVRAVQNVSLALAKGEILGLVGESGCGKSTLGRIAAGLLQPTAGEALLHGRTLRKHAGEREALKVQMVFQNPMASLNARMSIARIIAEAPLVHGMIRRAEMTDYAAEQLARVGLDRDFLKRRPFQCSGGQRQRVGIARALAVRPEVLICDEPVTALDVSIQASILNLFMDLRRDLGLTMLFISHDLRVIRHLADRVAVMYLGQIVELGRAGDVLSAPAHPYTKGLLASQPQIATGRRLFRPVQGEIPSQTAPPPGCAYHPRCPFAVDLCRTTPPALRALAGREVACHRAEDVAAARA